MRPLACLVVASIVCASCARNPGAVEIPAEDLPFDVSRAPDVIETPSAERRYTVYLVDRGRLSAASRELEAGRSVAPLVTLRSLLEGPSSQEREEAITSEIPREVRLLDVEVADGGVARVDLSSEFQEPAEPLRIALRVAQVVWTLTELAEVSSVTFAIDGEPISVTTDGGDVERRVGRDDYQGFAPS
ncbi:MAG: GerMN domain-containing protein [Actinomycetota bacterium]